MVISYRLAAGCQWGLEPIDGGDNSRRALHALTCCDRNRAYVCGMNIMTMRRAAALYIHDAVPSYFINNNNPSQHATIELLMLSGKEIIYFYRIIFHVPICSE